LSGRFVLIKLRDCAMPLRFRHRVQLDFTDPKDWEAAAMRLRGLLGNPDPRPEVIPCPYPGIAPFHKEDSRFFYGRNAEIEMLLAPLRVHGFLLLLGSSGSGKSSLINAGLLPILDGDGAFPRGTWKVRTFRPGSAPLEELREQFGGDPDRPAEAVTALLGA